MKKIFYIVALMSEISLVAAIFILEKLAVKKAGVNHHVLARKIQWQETIFSEGNVKIINLLLTVSIALLLLLLVYSFMKKRSSKSVGVFNQIQLVAGILSAAVAIMSQKASFFLEMKITPYVTFAALAVFGMQLIILVISNLMCTRKRNN